MQHHFDVEIAEKYGVNCAILLNNLTYWVQKNEANEVNYFEGRYWTYNSIKAFKELFPYMSQRQIKYALSRLEEEGLIVTGSFGEDKYDRTLWYSVNFEKFTDVQKENEDDKIVKSSSTLLSNGYIQNCQMEYSTFVKSNSTLLSNVYKEANINTNINTDNKQKNIKKACSDKDRFNEFWDKYPRKTDKQKAYKAFKKLKLSDEKLDIIYSALERQKRSEQWQEVRFIPHASTWLNGKRWLDELPEKKPPKAGKVSKSKIQADSSYCFDKEAAERALFGD